jgi:hypothetical protein
MAGEARVRFSRKLEKKERRKRDARFFGGTYRLLTVGDVREVHEIGRDVAQLVVLSSASERKRMRMSSPSR